MSVDSAQAQETRPSATTSPLSERRVYILGGAQSDFARKISREGLEISDLFSETLARGFEETGC